MLNSKLNKANKLQKILDTQESYFENIETEQAPSGEWAEYNIHYITEEARTEGMETIVRNVGTCSECKFSQEPKSQKYKGKLACKINHGHRAPEWFCADYERKIEG